MPRTHRFLSVWTGIVLCLLFLPGCGKGRATIKGTLVLPPNVRLADTDNVSISFVPEDKNIQAFPADFTTSDNTFVAQGPANKGLLVGKYKIAVQIQPYPGNPDSEKRTNQFAKFNDKYASANSKLTYEVTSDSTQSITVDLNKGTITKN